MKKGEEVPKVKMVFAISSVARIFMNKSTSQFFVIFFK
jgi:hypothetical protein